MYITFGAQFQVGILKLLSELKKISRYFISFSRYFSANRKLLG